MDDDRECEACALASGTRELPGGLIHERHGWRVEHCVGPLGVGTLIVKPHRHVTAVADLTDNESAALGPLLRDASAVATALTDADQVYNCLWSHAGGVPVHIHYVIQPVTAAQIESIGIYGPRLQVEMFERGEPPTTADVVDACERARELFKPSEA
jgi:diadenosine tetraphosphate (Ap4A) HIT family hydrolase